jgi:hypothetical protein
MTKLEKLLARIHAAELAVRHGLRESRPGRRRKGHHSSGARHHASRAHARHHAPKRSQHHSKAKRGHR